MDVISVVTAALQDQLGTYLDDLARRCGVVRRQRKFTGQTLLRTLVLTLLRQPDATTADFRATATLLGLDVSATALDKRWQAGQPLIDFLRQALERALQRTVAAQPHGADVLQRFTAVFVGDSSVMALPDALADAFAGCGGAAGTSRAALKLHVLWDLKTGRLERLHVTAGRVGDAHGPIALGQAAAGALLIYDLGYFDVARFAALDGQHAHFLSRLQHGTRVAAPDGRALDLLAYLRRQPPGVVDQLIRLGATARLACRLLAVRVPEEVANRRRQQARRKARDHGREASAAYLELLGWNLFVTNCPPAQLGWRAVVVLYRARWQIEILFKLWKSHNGLARCRAGAAPLERLAVFYAKLLGVVLQHWLLLASVWQLPQRSLWQAARRLREWLVVVLRALDDGVQLAQVVAQLHQHLQRLARVKARKRHPSHAQLLNEPELLDWLP
jgi:Transposase DDE domain